ncbi:fatty acyl-AMP ligase [Nocardia otitidiscaviarum]|uniref:fatty acyl-AMP ligase n=1 Tax=Nocardia otitidiscaviarum TaxID=1823 RepID=UPI001892F6E9|nr:fatty acyl-AMP ligase [Nocardia otitidiscaviarum]MBF6241409.1 fatty acyl-AMP ligase [Nocardia otitidiscaviarum]
MTLTAAAPTALRPRHPSIVHALLDHLTDDSPAPNESQTARVVFVAAPGESEVLDYAALARAARRSAAALADYGVRPGDRVMLCLPTGTEFITAFFGAQLLGAIPVAVAPPSGFGGRGLFADKFARLVAYLAPAALVAAPDVLDALGAHRPTGTTVVNGVDLHARAVTAGAPEAEPRLPDGSDPAFIQCTSGSTGTPKGVVITHANLAANCEQITRVCGLGPGDNWAGWLPLNHDMGLIGGTLTPLFAGAGAVLMPPNRFLRAPAEWLRNVSDYGGTVAAAPNFGYGYAALRVRDEDLDGVDLSRWRFLFCGAEPIQADTLRLFTDRFAAWGLPRDAVVPCYGMAEASLAITVNRPRATLRVDTVSRDRLATEARVVDVPADAPDAVRVVDCGPAVPGTEIRVVDERGRPCTDNVLGAVQFRGPSRTPGYFQLPDATAACVVDGSWWDTGDLGYLRDGGLRITGRRKDLIIIRGANYFPSDFEQAAQTVPGVRLGGVAAVGYRTADAHSEGLHLIVEAEVDAAEQDALRLAIRSAVSSRTGVLADAVHLVPPRALPKTTSGKIQRAAARARFVATEETP